MIAGVKQPLHLAAATANRSRFQHASLAAQRVFYFTFADRCDREGSMKFCAAFVSLTVLSWTGQALAGPVVDAAQRSESLLAEGKPVEALAALDQAVDAAWEASPLVFRKAMLVEESSGFARYT